MGELDQLLVEYAREQGKRAEGGLLALSGFDIQLRLFLLDFVEALMAGDGLEVGGRVLGGGLEALSDYTTVDRGRLDLVQVKRTVSRTSANSAAVEFAAIDEFLERHEPSLRPFVRYSLRGRFTDGPAIDWTTITLPAKDRDKHPTYQARFETLVRDDRVLAPRTELDPRWALVAGVYPHIDDPLGFIREAVELCMTRELGDAEHLRERLIDAFERRRSVRLRRERPELEQLPGRPLGVADFEPEADESNSVLFGQIPTLRHLRRGLVMERPAPVRSFIAHVRQIIERRAEVDTEHAVHVLWIQGRSGVGKSTLLLQAMRSLVDAGESVLWLEHGAKGLNHLFDAWSMADEHPGNPVFVFVDDVYDPVQRRQVDLHRLGTLVAHSRDRPWPVLVTCGPPEFRAAFVRDTGRYGVEVCEPWSLRPADHSERLELRSWFKTRTNRVLRTSMDDAPSDVVGHDGLMMSMMIELLDNTNVRPFFTRFADRIVDADLHAALYEPLALNRLYIWPPQAWLREHRLKLASINVEADFDVFDVEDAQHDARIRLTHAHLADGLYRALPRADATIDAHPQVYAEELGRAFERALGLAGRHEKPDTRLVCDILAAVAERNSRLDDLDLTLLQAELCRSWAKVWAHGATELPLGWRVDAASEAWVSIALWASHTESVAAKLGRVAPEGPWAVSLVLLDQYPSNWQPQWRRLWRSKPGNEALLGMGLGWLDQSIELDADEAWQQVWRELAKHAPRCPRCVLRCRWDPRPDPARHAACQRARAIKGPAYPG